MLARMVTTSRTMIAAEVSARNSSWGLRAQSKTIIGRAVYGPVEQVGDGCRRVENEPRTAPTRMSGAVSPRARDRARTVPVRMPGHGRRQDELADDLPARRPRP